MKWPQNIKPYRQEFFYAIGIKIIVDQCVSNVFIRRSWVIEKEFLTR